MCTDRIRFCSGKDYEMNFIKGSLHNLAKENHPDPRYCQGIVLGIVTTLMSDEGGGKSLGGFVH